LEVTELAPEALVEVVGTKEVGTEVGTNVGTEVGTQVNGNV
jgi:hypothetical protein